MKKLLCYFFSIVILLNNKMSFFSEEEAEIEAERDYFQSDNDFTKNVHKAHIDIVENNLLDRISEIYWCHDMYSIRPKYDELIEIANCKGYEKMVLFLRKLKNFKQRQ